MEEAMVKMVTSFRLKPGFDPEESYQLWLKKHVPYVKTVMSPELKGYVVGRVVHSLAKGDEYFGVVQLSYDTVEDAVRALGRLLSNPEDEFMQRMTDFRRVIIEEKDVMR
jgi:hypothetical protein